MNRPGPAETYEFSDGTLTNQNLFPSLDTNLGWDANCWRWARSNQLQIFM